MKSNLLKSLVMVLIIILVAVSFAGCKGTNVTDGSVMSDTTYSKQDDVSSKEDTSATDTSTDNSSSADTESEKPTVSSQPTPSSKPAAVSKPANTSRPTVSSTPTPSQPQKPAKKTPKELVIGKWTAKHDFTEEFADLGYDVSGIGELDIGMEFTSSGTYIATMDSRAFKTMLRPVMLQAIENQCVEEGIPKEDFELQFQQETGMTVAEYVESVLTYFDQGFNVVSEYKFEGNTLLIKELEQGSFVECEYEFINDNTLVSIDGGSRITYKRVS